MIPLVPTLEKMVQEMAVQDFLKHVRNYEESQADHDRQNEPCLRIKQISLPEGFGK